MAKLMQKDWSEIANWRENALAKRCSKVHEKLSEHTKNLADLVKGNAVLVQNQLGNSPRRWDKRGVIVEVLPHRQYQVMMDGSRTISLRNRKFRRMDATEKDHDQFKDSIMKAKAKQPGATDNIENHHVKEAYRQHMSGGDLHTPQPHLQHKPDERWNRVKDFLVTPLPELMLYDPVANDYTPSSGDRQGQSEVTC